MKFKTQLQHKEPVIDTDECRIVAVETLEHSQFDHFQKHLLDDYDFIADHAENLYKANESNNCLLVLGEGFDYGILVNSEGSAYARYSAVLPRAKEIFDAQIKRIADYCVYEGTHNTTDGKWTISYDEIFNHFGTEITPNNGIGSPLLDRLKQQEEIDMVIATEDEFEMEYHLEYCPECQQGGLAGAFSLLSLIGCNFEGVHIKCDDSDEETDFIPNFNADTLTEEGKAEFADVLCATVSKISTGHHGAVIHLSGCSFARAKELAKVLRAECSLDEYYRLVAPKPGEVRSPMRTVSQDDMELAVAEHKLWLLDSPKGVQARFENCDLYGLDLRGKELNNAVFSNCRIKDCRFSDAELCFASFCNSRIEHCDFTHATAEDADFTDAFVCDSNLREVQMSGSNLSHAIFEGCNVDCTHMNYSCFVGTAFPDTYIEGAYVR